MDRMTDEERALLHKAAEAYEDEQRKYQSYEQQLLERIRELESIIDADVSLLKQFRLEVAGYKERIGQLEADYTKLLKRDTANLKKLNELQRKYDALVEGVESAQSHTRETLRLLQWDQLGWDVPEEVIESLGNADSELRALLEDDDE